MADGHAERDGGAVLVRRGYYGGIETWSAASAPVFYYYIHSAYPASMMQGLLATVPTPREP